MRQVVILAAVVVAGGVYAARFADHSLTQPTPQAAIVEPAQSGTIFVRSPSCKEMAKVKVYAAKAATVQRAPSFTG